MSAAEVFARVTTALDRAGIAYMLAGSFASAYYGAMRSTQDIDFVIEATAEQLRAFVQSLPGEEYYVDLETALTAYQRQSQFNIIEFKSGWKIDLIIRKARAFSEEEFLRRRSVHLLGLSVFVASAEDVVISKLEWAKKAESRRQVEDAAGILSMQWGVLDHAYVKRWITELQLEGQWSDAKQSANIVE